MKQKEKELLKALCAFKQKKFNESLLTEASASVLGHLFLNRMQGIAYGVLKSHGLLSSVTREFRTALRTAYEQNTIKNKSFFRCLQYLDHLLSGVPCQYAMLKGAVLCQQYPEGYRTSNDIDLLVLPEDVTKIGEVLSEAGFIQGYIRNDDFIPATRKEIIESKMMRGETVPYIKEINLPNMKYLEVDLNFSLDYKNGNIDALRDMLQNCDYRKDLTVPVTTLSWADFFIHLCGHLHKEATTMPWIKMKRDMTLYKYCDIYVLLSEMDAQKVESLFERAKELGMEKIVAFAILQTMALFQMDNSFVYNLATRTLENDLQFVHTVVSPRDKKTYVYKQKNFVARFYSNDRAALLKEVNTYGKTKNETK